MEEEVGERFLGLCVGVLLPLGEREAGAASSAAAASSTAATTFGVLEGVEEGFTTSPATLSFLSQFSENIFEINAFFFLRISLH